MFWERREGFKCIMLMDNKLSTGESILMESREWIWCHSLGGIELKEGGLSYWMDGAMWAEVQQLGSSRLLWGTLMGQCWLRTRFWWAFLKKIKTIRYFLQIRSWLGFSFEAASKRGWKADKCDQGMKSLWGSMSADGLHWRNEIARLHWSS